MCIVIINKPILVEGIYNMIIRNKILFSLFIGFSFCFIFNNVNELLWAIGFIIMIICGILETKQ